MGERKRVFHAVSGVNDNRASLFQGKQGGTAEPLQLRPCINFARMRLERLFPFKEGLCQITRSYQQSGIQWLM